MPVRVNSLCMCVCGSLLLYEAWRDKHHLEGSYSRLFLFFLGKCTNVCLGGGGEGGGDTGMGKTL
jgi:hypothetical protein